MDSERRSLLYRTVLTDLSLALSVSSFGPLHMLSTVADREAPCSNEGPGTPWPFPLRSTFGKQPPDAEKKEVHCPAEGGSQTVTFQHHPEDRFSAALHAENHRLAC